MIGVKMLGRASQGIGAWVGEGLSGLLEATGTLSSVCLPPTCSAATPPRILPPDEVKVAQLRLTLCDPVDYTSRWNSSGENTRVGSLSLLQGIFPTQG